MESVSQKKQLAKDIVQDLDAGRPIAMDFAAGSQVRIERPQPFLCLYRQPLVGGEVRAEELLTTQASYLVVEEDDFDSGALTSLLEAILACLCRHFSNVLLIEIWIGEVGEAEPQTGLFLSDLTLHAQHLHAPIETLEELERALISSRWLSASSFTIEVKYDKVPGPKEMGPPLSPKYACNSNVYLIGIEVPPFFLYPSTGELLPQVFAKLRSNLGKAIRRAAYTFIEYHTNYSPAHYHELGPGKIESLHHQVDSDLASIDDKLNLLLNVTPINVDQAWLHFRSSNFSEAPEFHYRALLFDPAELKHRLYEIPINSVEDPALHSIFVTKRIELDRQLTMLNDRGTQNFLLESQQVYGGDEIKITRIAKKLLKCVPAHTHDDRASHFLDATRFAQYAEREIEYYLEQDPNLATTVTVRPDIPGLMVSHGNFLISESAQVPEHRIDATLQHEIGTHALTYHNGGCQPLKLLKVGLAGYEELQEGIAVLAEYLVGGLSRPRIRQIAGRVVAVSQLIRGAGFVKVFRSMHDDYGFSQQAAYNISMRVFRGGGFTKDAIYLRGLIEVLEYLQRGEQLETLLVGKIALQHTDITEELLWRKILKPPKLLPRYLETDRSSTRLKEIQGSGNPMKLVLEYLL
jgi:uncharacterized protein (TIGR02421 family)